MTPDRYTSSVGQAGDNGNATMRRRHHGMPLQQTQHVEIRIRKASDEGFGPNGTSGITHTGDSDVWL